MIDKRTKAQRWSDATAEFCGSWGFILWFSVALLVWILGNTVWLIFGKFDPYPFIALNLVITIISTLQSPLIMMSQNRQTERDREAIKELHAKLDEILRRKE